MFIQSNGGSNSAETDEKSCKCCATTTFLPQNITFQGQSCTSVSSSDDDSNILEGSGSMYSPEKTILEYISQKASMMMTDPLLAKTNDG